MTSKRKATFFILLYIIIGIIGMICSGGTAHVLRLTHTEVSLETNASKNLHLIDTNELDEAVMMLYQDHDHTFYQYPIVKDIPAHCPKSELPESITWLTLSQASRRIPHRKNICVLKMSIVVENKDQLPLITDSLGSEFRLRTKEAETGETLLYVRKIFKGDIPQNYILWIDDQEIILN